MSKKVAVIVLTSVWIIVGVFGASRYINSKQVSYEPKIIPVEDKSAYFLPEPTSYPVQLTEKQAKSLRVVVNKKYRLPEDYVPELTEVSGGGQMRPEAAMELERMLDDAAQQGLVIRVISPYRSYQNQVDTYTGYVNQVGQTLAETFSARPGHSEHQTGLAVDLGNSNLYCALDVCFGQTEVGKWLATNGANYGFIISYPEGKEDITGYQYEPWHLRFVGIKTAKAIVTTGQTINQFYSLAGGGY